VIQSKYHLVITAQHVVIALQGWTIIAHGLRIVLAFIIKNIFFCFCFMYSLEVLMPLYLLLGNVSHVIEKLVEIFSLNGSYF